MLSTIDRQQIIRCIEQHQPLGDREAQHRTAILDLLHNCPAPLSRENYEPGHITASAWIVAEETNQIALIYHRRITRWLQPGGHVDPGETDLRSVALREVQEEMGIAPDPLKTTLFDVDVHSIPATPLHPSHQHFDVRFLCRVEPQPLFPASDAEQGKWFSIDEVRHLASDDGTGGSMERMLKKCLQQGILRE
ncbi:NUDIX hydrolase [Leptolyngbya ohadii]|uniref:NUDIX hydrolase n=1 Tax=Leptolyngbya ohadii TaxID=1962290 RepID=UPI000B59E82A|nr:NUDIX hydrolase [Leptolyngbya ohadii]